VAKKFQAVTTTQKVGRLKRAGRPLLSRRWFQALVILAMGAALAALIVFEPDTRPPLPELIVGEPAPDDVFITHSFAVIREDTARLEERQAQAAREVPTVFDFDLAVADEVGARVGPAFEKMRGVLRDAARAAQEPPPLPEPEPEPELVGTGIGTGIGTGEGTGVVVRALPPPLALVPPDPMVALTPEERVLVLQARRQEFNRDLDAGPPPDAFATLSRAGFDRETQRFLEGLLSQILSAPILDQRDLRRLENEDHIVIRTVVEGRALGEAPRTDFLRLLTDDQARRHLRELADQEPHSLEPDVVDALVDIARELVRANGNTQLNRGETELRRRQARAAVEITSDTAGYAEGTLLLHAGQIVTEREYEIVQLMRLSSDSSRPAAVHTNEVVIGGVLYVLLVLTGVILYGIRFVRRFETNFRDLAYLTMTLVVMVALTRIVMLLAGLIVDKSPEFPVQAIYAAIPFAAGGLLVRLVLNNEHALIYSIVYSLLIALMLPSHPVFPAYALIGSLVGIGAVDVATTRIAVFRAGVLVGLVNMTFAGAMGLLESRFLTIETLLTAGFGLFSGLFVAIVASSLVPIVESTFHYITDIKLLELSNPNHPAIRELLLRAPGSYQHSMMVGSLVEAACKAIGAHALLGRVGAYYHDIGKSKNPKYFAENQAGKNPHDKLKPHMSALIIKSHVKDGVEMAEAYGLPEEIIRFIREHHGTSLIAYFFHKAKEMEDPEIEAVDEADFRYPGPKPQTTETAVCLLADGIEAASRAMQDPTPARLQGLVQRMINNAFSSGQLDECDLTLRDLDAIAREFIRILCSIYHHRPEYPKGPPAPTRISAETRRLTEAETTRLESARLKTTQPSAVAAAEAERAAADLEENANGSGDSGPPHSPDDGLQSDAPEEERPATLRRLGLD
jgi:cyclic-di-AMP phosphodiesterase PgpH